MELDRRRLKEQIHELYRSEHEAMGERGTLERLERGREWNLAPTLAAGGVAVFPHAGVFDCGHQVAAVVHGCLDSRRRARSRDQRPPCLHRRDGGRPEACLGAVRIRRPGRSGESRGRASTGVTNGATTTRSSASGTSGRPRQGGEGSFPRRSLTALRSSPAVTLTGSRAWRGSRACRGAVGRVHRRPVTPRDRLRRMPPERQMPPKQPRHRTCQRDDQRAGMKPLAHGDYAGFDARLRRGEERCPRSRPGTPLPARRAGREEILDLAPAPDAAEFYGSPRPTWVASPLRGVAAPSG